MQRHHSYPYGFGAAPAPAAAPPRYAAHGTSSAQSPSANPDEDWTKISDLAERRRIQNRIAQRNYRKKLKRRLEDLERRAGSSSASPEQKPAEIVPSQKTGAAVDPKKRRSSKPGLGKPPTPARSPLPPVNHDGMFTKQYTRQLSTSPPPSLTYSYGPADAAVPAMQYPQHSAPYGQSQLPPPPGYDYAGANSVYLPPLPMARAGYGYDGGAKEASNGYGGDDDIMHNFHFSYASMHGVDAPTTTQGFGDPTQAYAPHVSDSYGYSSRHGSPQAGQSLSFAPPPSGSMGVSHPVLGF